MSSVLAHIRAYAAGQSISFEFMVPFSWFVVAGGNLQTIKGTRADKRTYISIGYWHQRQAIRPKVNGRLTPISAAN